MLTEVHRQARDNPIIRLSMTIRDGGRLPLGRHGESRVLSRREIDAAEVTRADQVLVGLNRTRRLYVAAGAARISKILFAIFFALFLIVLVFALLAGQALF
jgi:hypothetical protein